jgi:hypothetical protein
MSNNIVVDAEATTAETPVVPVVPEVTPTTDVVENNNVTAEVVNTTEAVAEIPAKFAGKTSEEIIDSYQNLEKELGRKAQEVGELRKLSDSFLQAQLQSNEQNLQNNQTEVAEPVDFFDNPDQAVNQAIENHPKFKEFQRYQTAQVQSSAKAQLETKHPDFSEIVQDAQFQEWVGESKIRQQLFQSADKYNYDAADELLNNWKDRSMINKTQEVEKQASDDRKKALTAGATESRSSAGSTGGDKFKRADLIRMKLTDPGKYESMQDDIYKAYAEGRVI